MHVHRSFLLARALMAASLILLGCSLLWFLWRTYKEEKAALSREVGFVFINTLRNIEGGLLDKLVLRHALPHAPDLPILPKGLATNSDSVKVLTFIGREETTTDTANRQFEIRVSRTSSIRGGGELPVNELKGSISMFIAMSGDTAQAAIDTAAFLPRLRAEFGKALTEAGLPVHYRVSRMAANQAEAPRALVSGLYTDLANGERYGAELSRYELFLFQKMLPQILFALLLFGCVALAFVFVFRNLRTQRRLAELKTEFIQNISHELKTPIATMSVALEALRDFDALKNPGQTEEYLDISRLELQRLSLLVEKVLGIAQLERPDKVNLNITELDLLALVNDTLAALRPRFEQASARITLDTEGADFLVQGDRLHLSGVLFNLLDNALKYGGKHPVIRIHLRAADGKIALRVQDNGPGIPPEHRARIFDAFFRVPSREGHRVKGHGLGLCYAAKVAEQHGGTITLDEAPANGGTSFTVELNHATCP